MAAWHRHGWLAYLAVFIGVLGHASTEFFSVLSGIGGPELSVWRFVLGGAGLIGVALALPDSRDLLAPMRTHGGRLIGLSLLGITAGYLMFHWALDFATVPQVATIVTSAPLFVGIANLLVNRQPLGTAKIISGLCALVGIALLITDGYLARLAGSAESLIGVFLALGCALTISVYMVFVKPIIAIYGALRITALTMAIGAFGLWALVGAAFGAWIAPARLFEMTPLALGSLLTIAFWNTTITQFLWIGGLAAAPDITRASYLFFLKPVIAALLAVAILDQSLTAVQIAAIGVVTASVAAEFLVGKLAAPR